MFRQIVAAFTLLLAAACPAAMVAGDAGAAETILYVSTVGSNSNPCTLAKPCRSLQYAINKTPAGGELHVLDSGFYGNNATVNRPMTIDGNGHTVTLGAPITVNSAGATVALRGLAINGQASTVVGIDITAAAAVHVDHCIIYDQILNGIILEGTDIKLFISNTIVRDNGGSGITDTGTGTSSLTIDNSRLEGNAFYGLYTSVETAVTRSVAFGNRYGFAATSRMTIRSSSVAQHTDWGIYANVGSEVTLESVVSHGNDTGLTVATGGVARISNSTFTGNATGILNGGTTETRGNNTVRGNTANTTNNALSAIGGL
jgi:Right handed beta helix region